MRRAYVFGSNGPATLDPLRYARSDATRMAETLAAPLCDFAVATPPEGSSAWAVRENLIQEAETCTADDTFVVYFSGHGALDHGALFLFWDNTERERLLGTSIPISAVMEALRHSRAHSKLLILDCCHAGAAVSMAGVRSDPDTPVAETDIRPDNHLVLMASDRLERARELESLRGGFLTHHLCAALTDRFSEADANGDSRLTIDELKGWLEGVARAHNRRAGTDQVPIPYLFGKQKGSFLLTAGEADWRPQTYEWPDGTSMVLLPTYERDREGSHALCIARHPISNRQYRRFVEETDFEPPHGEHFRDQRWAGPFSPWDEPDFDSDDQPVVCVSYLEAFRYCGWVRGLASEQHHRETGLPSAVLWDFAAFGTVFPPRKPASLLAGDEYLHQRAQRPALLDSTIRRRNARGVSDMLGNIWEWCARREEPELATLGWPPVAQNVELRGGSYLDDLEHVSPFFDTHRLERGVETRHSDLGFRIAARVPLDLIEPDVAARLTRFPAIRRDKSWQGTVAALGVAIGSPSIGGHAREIHRMRQPLVVVDPFV